MKYELPPPIYERARFLAHSAEDAFAALRRYGVAVWPSGLPRERLRATADGLLTVLRETFPGFEPNDPATYQHLRNHGLVHGMLVQTHGLGWAQPVVDVRQDPAIVDAFVQLWNLRMAETGRPATLTAADMLSSADGVAAYFNHTDLRGGFQRNSEWLHWDRAPGDGKAWSVQSFLNLFPHQEGGAAFQCLPKSHRDQAEFAVRFPDTAAKRFHMLDDQAQVDFYVRERGRAHVCIAAEPGDLVLWDSRTIHAGRAPPKPKAKTPSRLYRRLAIYVSMQPARLASPRDLKRKRRAYAPLRSPTHYAAHGVELFNVYPRIRGARDEALKSASRPIAQPPRLTPLGRTLFCAAE